VLLYTDPAFWLHDTGLGHPERPQRLEALVEGVRGGGFDVDERRPATATAADLGLVHDPHYIDLIERFCAKGGGKLDADTMASPESWTAALLAAGSGLSAIEALRAEEGHVAVCAVRPPGHHARRDQAMGFCLFNNIAVAAAALSRDGDRVAIVDWDVHHGNGTQEMFFKSAEVLFVSIHQWGPQPDAPAVPFYPGTGWLDEVGSGAGRGTTVNVPVPPATTGGAYQEAFSGLVRPVVEQFDPDWLLISAGFDAHRSDPLAHIGLVEADYAALAAQLVDLGPTILFTEGGYDLEALKGSMTATLNGFDGAAITTGSSRSPDAAFRLISQATSMAEESGALT